jgi:type IV pilus assembly protein PilW
MTQALWGQRGMTMAELMVSMTLGLAVLLAAGALLVSANAAYVSQVEAAAVDDGGRYALEIIGRSLRQAAFVDWERIHPAAAIDPAAPAHLDGLDERSISKASDGIRDPLPDAVNGSDVLAVRFAGAGPAPDGDGSVTSCAGFPVSELEQGWSIFYVARNAAGEAELRCKYRGAGSWGADAVVAGVDSFQVLYGIDTDTPPDGVANCYVNANALAALDAGLVLAGATAEERELDRLGRTHWKRIVSVKAALLLHGAKAAHGEELRTYDLFGSAYGEAFGDQDRGTRLREDQLAAERGQRERRLFAATFVMRNRPR